MHIKILAMLVLVAFIMQPLTLITLSNNSYGGYGQRASSMSIEKKGDKVYVVKRLPDKVIIMEMEVKTAKTQQAGNTTHGLWWDISWEYRVNITVMEPNVMDRTEWPVDILMVFSPPAHKYSVRVIEVLSSSPYFQEVPYQIWNVTYYNSTHISSATITFLVSISKGQSKTYQIYWSISEKNAPSYDKKVLISETALPSGIEYTVASSYGWTMVIPPTNQGKPTNMTLQSGDRIGHTYLYFGPTRNPSLVYDGYLGTGNTNNEEQMAYRGILEDTDSLAKMFKGVVFVTYKVEGANLLNGTNLIAKLNCTFRIYPWGIVVEEKIKWLTADSDVDYYIGGWVFDQDNDSGVEPTFDRVGTESEVTQLASYYQYPSVSGSMSSYVDATIYDPSTMVYPNLRVHRHYLATGSHTIEVRPDEQTFVQRDQHGIIVYDPNGTLVGATTASRWAWDPYARVSFTVDSGEEGYYHIIVYGYDNRVGDSTLPYDIYVDGSLIASNVVGELGRIAADSVANSIAVVDISVPTQMQNIIHEVKLDWTTTANLDLYIYDRDGAVLNLSRTSQPEIAMFNATQSGHYTALIHAVDAASTFVAEITAYAGPEFVDDTGYGSWNELAFFHSTEPRGVGMGILSEDIPGAVTPTAQTFWHNKGDEGDNDYIYWARNVSGLSVSAGDILNMSYAVIPWSPSGSTDSERYSGFNTTLVKVRNPLSCSKGSVERYLIRVAVNVVDKSGLAIPNANVSFRNSTGHILYTTLTDSNGQAVLNVKRMWYNITVQFSSGGLSYLNYTTVNYSNPTYGYGVHNDSRTIKFSYVVRLEITAYSRESPPSRIQGGEVLLNSSATKNSRGADITIGGITNVYGKFIVYIPNGTWSIRFNKTTTAPEDWDNITIYSDSALTNNITPPGRIHTLGAQNSTKWHIRDWEYPPVGVNTIATYFEVTAIPSPLTVYWKENIMLNVSLYESLGDTLINGTVCWYIFDADENLIDSGGGTTDGLYFALTLNTSTLDAGATYTIHINGTVTEPPSSGYTYLDPQPVDKDLTVKIRLTEMDATFSPSTAIYWNESLKISVTYMDSILSSSISGALVRVRILNVGEWNLSEVSPGVYELYIANFYWDAETYTVIVTASKANYEQKEKSFTILIYERPTDLNAPTYLEIPWQDEYNVSVEYIDSRLSTPIVDANVTYEVRDVAENIINSNQCIYVDGSYIATINISILDEGVYYIYFYAQKTNYEQKTAKMVLEIRVRSTNLMQSTTKISVIYEQRIIVKFDYYDDDFGEWIVGASATYIMEGVDVDYWAEGELQDLGNGSYLFNISSIDVGKLGTFTVSILLSKTHYESQSATVTVIISEIPTEAMSSTTAAELEWGLNISLRVWWNRTDKTPEEGIASAANASYKLYYNNTLVETGSLRDLVNGTYLLDLNTTVFVNSSFPNLGTYMLYIFLEKPYYQNQTLVVSITVNPVSMVISALTTELSLIWGYSSNVTIYYNRTRDGAFIFGATETITSSPDAPGAYTWFEKSGKYILEINSTYMQDGQSYVVNVTLKKPFHTPKTIIISVDVSSIPTVASSSLSSATTEYGLNLTVEFWYNRTDTDEGISNASATYEIKNSAGITIISYALEEDASIAGKYYLTINSSIVVDANTTPSVGTYTIYAFFTKSHYESRTLVITWTITVVATTAYAQPANISMIWGYTETVNIYYNRKRDDAFVKNATVSVDSTPSAPGAFNISESASFYVLKINGSALIEGTYTVTIGLSKDYYEPQSLTIRIDVSSIPTVASSSLSSATTEYGLNLTVEFWYNRTDTDEGISNASATYEIRNSSDLAVYSNNLTEDSLIQGRYYLVINSTAVVDLNNPPSVGTYYIHIAFSKSHHESRSIIITWNIIRVQTVCYATSTNISLIWSDAATIGIYYNRTRDGAFIKNANHTLEVYDEYGNPVVAPSEAFVITEDINVHRLNINTTYLEVTLYVLEITFSKDHHDLASVRIFVRVDPIPAYAVPNVKSVSVEYPSNFTIKVWYYTNKYNITDANATYAIDYGGVIIDSGNLTFNSTDNSYELLINSRDLFSKSGASDLPISLTVYTYLSKEHHESKTLILAVTIEPIKTKLMLSEKSATLRYGQVWTFYMNYTNLAGDISLYDADTQYNISYNGTLILNGTIPYNLTDGWYVFYLVFNSTYVVNKTLEKMDIRLPAVFEIRIKFSKKMYETQTAVLSVTVNPMETILDVSASSVTIVYGESWLFNFSYIDIVAGVMITDAVAYYEIFYGNTLLKKDNLTYNSTHKYYMVFDTTELINESWPHLGTYVIHVYFWKRFYEVREKYISVTVEPRDTYIDVSATTVMIEYGESYLFEIKYIDTKTTTIIENASKRMFRVVFNETAIWSGNLTYDPAKGAYYLLFDSRRTNGSWPLGTYVIYVELWESFYRENTKVLSVTITEIKTLAYAQPKNITVIWGQAPIVEAYYVVAKNGSIISGASVTISSTPETPEGAFYITYEEGRYVMRVNSSLLSVDMYYLVNITMEKKFYEKGTIVVRVDVVPIPTYLVLPQKTYELEYGEFMDLNIWYLVYGADEIIEGANATYAIYYEDYMLKEGNFTFNETTGGYRIRLDTFSIADLILSATGSEDIELPTTVSIEIFFSKSVYLRQYEVLTLTIKKFTVDLSMTKAPPKEILKIQLIEEHKTSEIEVLVTHRNLPVENAMINVIISSVQANITKTYSAEMVGPGLFRVVADWADFPPGYRWTVSIQVGAVKTHDRWIPVDKIVYTIQTRTVFMDYVSGSTKISVPGLGSMYIANMFLYPIIAVLLVVFAYASYRVISWWLLPWQVKEINKILKLIEKGVFEYKAPERREYIMELLADELEIEIHE